MSRSRGGEKKGKRRELEISEKESRTRLARSAPLPFIRDSVHQVGAGASCFASVRRPNSTSTLVKALDDFSSSSSS